MSIDASFQMASDQQDRYYYPVVGEDYSDEQYGAIQNKLFSNDNSMNVGIDFKKYEDIPVHVSGREPPPHMENFNDTDLGDVVLRNIELAHYTKPTPVLLLALVLHFVALIHNNLT